MTIDECKKYLPNRWAEIIQQDPLLMEIFEEHDYDLEEEAVPPFLFQELRGGNIEHLRPIFALYGQTGLNELTSPPQTGQAMSGYHASFPASE